jgi:chromosomal replication initiator protein
MTNEFEADYTFDSFVATPNNELAFEAAQAIVREVGTRFNPFFFHGKSGSGKTHLLHAIGNAIQEQVQEPPHPAATKPWFLIRLFGVGDDNIDVSEPQPSRPTMKSIFIEGADFVSDVSYALKKHRLTRFYQHYQNCDFLMIDGFEAFADKDIEQNAVIRLFDAMWKQKKQIIVASGLPSYRFPVIEEYFRTSYDTGLICDISSPEVLVANRAFLWRD